MCGHHPYRCIGWCGHQEGSKDEKARGWRRKEEGVKGEEEGVKEGRE